MEHISEPTREVTINYFAQLTLEHLTQIWHATQDRALDLDLTTQHFNAMEPLMEYHIDGIDEAADDEAQSNLRRLVAAAIFDLQISVQLHERNKS